MQIKAGVDLFQVFESSGSVLSQEECRIYSIPYLEKISESLAVPCITFMKGSCKHIQALKTSSLPYLSFDYDLPMKTIRDTPGNTRVLQGNLDPNLLFENEEVIEKHILALLEWMKHDPSFIFNLGHGVVARNTLCSCSEICENRSQLLKNQPLMILDFLVFYL